MRRIIPDERRVHGSSAHGAGIDSSFTTLAPRTNALQMVPVIAWRYDRTHRESNLIRDWNASFV